MIRERQLNSLAFSAGQTSTVDLPRDAVYHMLQLSIQAGTVVSTQAAMGTGGTLEANFPFCLFKQIRLIRNGSDVVFQGSGSQLAKEHYYLNKNAPFARLYTLSANVETLRTATVRGVTVPSNSDGIAACQGGFTLVTAAGSSSTLYFDCQVELWLQMGPEDAYYGTLVDARPLATLQLEVQWAAVADLESAVGTGETIAVTATCNVLSIDQDNVPQNEKFGTFKRSGIQQANIPYGSNNQQVLLPRGNFFHGIIIQTRAYKAASTTVPSPENACISSIENRINSNFSLRKVNFMQLQAKNMSDMGGRPQAWCTAGAGPQGWAYLYYPVATEKASELVPTYVMDQFDLLISTPAIGSSQNGVTTAATNPIIDLLLQEVIPGVSVSDSAPRGAQAGSRRATSAKPYG